VTYLTKIAEGLDFSLLRAQLTVRQHLWNQITYRKEGRGTPHSQMDDIWLRYRSDEAFKARGDYHGIAEGEFHCVFYPAWSELPAVRPICFALMTKLEAVELGTMIIYRLAPGKRIDPHTDAGWAVNYYSTKIHVCLQGGMKCGYRVMNEFKPFKTGDVYIFDNRFEHEIVNETDEDMIMLVQCMHCE
jgi:mannose-6-phosphate isomerase-like protein (cupin superfamily)